MSGRARQQIGQQANATLKRTAALDIVRKGGKYQDVVDAGIYASTGAVSFAVREALKIARAEMVASALDWQALQVERLTDLLGIAWKLAENGSKDHIEICRKLINDISDLTGAKAPVRVEIGVSDVDSLIGRLRRDVAAGEAALAGAVVDGEVLDPAEGADL